MQEKRIGLVMVDVPEATLGLTKFLLHHCEIKVVPVAAKTLGRKTAWSSFGAVLLPGGGAELYHRDLGKRGTANLMSFVRNGGGCVCICAGCIFALEIGLLTGTVFSMPGVGVYRLQNRKPHPVFTGYNEREGIPILRINGPFMELTTPTDSLADYDLQGRYACIAARTLDQGRVVGFSAHPEGGLAWGGGNYNPYFFFDGKTQNTAPLLKNALYWTMRKKPETSDIIPKSEVPAT